MRNVEVEQIVLKKLYILQNKLQEHLFICNCGSPDSVFFGWKGYRNHQNNFHKGKAIPNSSMKTTPGRTQTVPSFSFEENWWKMELRMRELEEELHSQEKTIPSEPQIMPFPFSKLTRKTRTKNKFYHVKSLSIQISFISTTQSMPTAKSA